MTLCELDVVNGHLIAHFPDGVHLIDTGAPISIPASAEVQEMVGCRVDLILGLDRLDGQVLGFDTGARSLAVEPDWATGDAVQLERRHGIPVVRISSNGTSCEAILDTGAKLSYAPASVVRGGTDRQRQQDFAPGIAAYLGAYKVETSVLEVQVGPRLLTIRAAAPPVQIRSFLEAMGMPDWIIGSDLFTQGRVVLDLRNDRLIFAGSGGTA